ncbi:MAG: hypothetical protein Satyrvirus5_27 [Satyrvirus sp.]|uniref:Uncharacterized protein n=1 Tax=Satyrvirus sp. TaxID=2487771 RepID=A0A3G5ADA5_9VIRU|nr:MAG: hypothetical protein Satyrvirus5_27 [Satyrvirus sp.]
MTKSPIKKSYKQPFKIPRKKQNKELLLMVSMNPHLVYDIDAGDNNLTKDCYPELVQMIKNKLASENNSTIDKINKIITENKETKKNYVDTINETYGKLAFEFEECLKNKKEFFQVEIYGKQPHFEKPSADSWKLYNKIKMEAINIFINRLMIKGYGPIHFDIDAVGYDDGYDNPVGLGSFSGGDNLIIRFDL